ncbi:MAG: ribonuclease HII [Bryobacteraceae bacterium]|nr:ribonuclease HII [Bryobacteraceae bacterium]
MRATCHSAFERRARKQGFRWIAGVDEVGRGCLFGPVVAAAVILPESHGIRGLNDSKLLEPEERERLDRAIRERAVAWAIGRGEVNEIDQINILQASRLAMRRAVESLSVRPQLLLVDAVTVESPIPQKALIKGDARSHSIAAASIVAKVFRDRLLQEWDTEFPAYGLGRNKGYGTPEHKAALERWGPTPLHRRTFAPVRQLELFTMGAGA